MCTYLVVKMVLVVQLVKILVLVVKFNTVVEKVLVVLQLVDILDIIITSIKHAVTLSSIAHNIV